MSFRAIPYLMFAALLSTSVVCSVATSAGHADLRLVEPAAWKARLASSQDAPASSQDFQVVTARPIKAKALAILPFSQGAVMMGANRPAGSTSVTLVIHNEEGDVETSYWLKPKIAPRPDEVSARAGEASAVTPFWLLASQPESVADTDETTAQLVYQTVRASVPCAIGLQAEVEGIQQIGRCQQTGGRAVPKQTWRGKGASKISLKFLIMTNERDIPEGTRLCIGGAPP